MYITYEAIHDSAVVCSAPNPHSYRLSSFYHNRHHFAAISSAIILYMYSRLLADSHLHQPVCRR